VAQGANKGFPAAVNEGIRRTEAELLVLLNNDTRADPKWLERVVAALDETPEAAFASCKLLQFYAPHAIDAAGDGYSLYRASGFPIARGDPRDAYERRAWVFGACAAAAAYRRSLFDHIGLFDEEFVLSFEDIDMDLRAQVAGHRCLYVPDAVVYHKRGASTDEWSPEFRGRGLRNRIWAAGKNLPGPLLAFWLIVLAPRMVRLFASLALGRQPHVQPSQAPRYPRRVLLKHHGRGLREGLFALPRKRRAVRPLRRVGSIRLLPALTCKHGPVSGDGFVAPASASDATP
jgi:GT2 family glycosyltransferase